MKEKVIVLVIKGKEHEVKPDDFPIPIKVRDKKTGKCDPADNRTLEARVKEGKIKIRCY